VYSVKGITCIAKEIKFIAKEIKCKAKGIILINVKQKE
jgi:hypothetical protein